jgi:phenylalanyl-tRNA synthetase beta chain
MQFPESWLREFCDPPIDTTQLSDLLTLSGMEVEEARPLAPPFSGVVVAQILEAVQHPNADRLRVCKVDAGPMSPAGPLQIVCGAPNARAGIKVPLAMVGASLPPGEDGKPYQIKVGKLRGVESHGMLCSARELQVSGNHDGLLELDDSATPGQSIREHLRLDDTVFTLKLTPNLGHCLSVFGIAREVSALTGAPMKTPGIEPVAPRHDHRLPVRIEAADLCGRFSGRVIRGIDPKATTPAWMVDRLARCGQRSVSALVDISNYVMFEYGRPTHVFDLDKIAGDLSVRWARSGETLKLLNGCTIELDASVGVIADANGVESLAGIMGGDHTAVSDDTRNVYVEAAFWWPEAVAGRSRRYAFSTDAGHRFERGVDPALTAAHIERITQLIIDICGGEAGPMDDQITALPERRPVTLRVERAAKVIGMPLTQAECEGVLQRLGLPMRAQPGRIEVTPPSWRFDLQIEEDLIEEVARVIGYGRLPATAPLAPVRPRPQHEARRSANRLRHALAALGYFETINFSFVEARWERELAGNDEPIHLLNPIAAPLAVMRSSLIGSLVQVLKHNLARRASRVRVFEVGKVYHRDAGATAGPRAVAGVRQSARVAALAYGPAAEQQWGEAERAVDFFDIKGDLQALLAPQQARFEAALHPALHPGRSARIVIDGQPAGFVGELHPQWRQAYDLPVAPVLFEVDLQALQARTIPAYASIARQQPVLRDLAVVVGPQVGHDQLIECARAADEGGLLAECTLFDIYQPKQAAADFAPGERSMAVRLLLQADEAPLTDEQADAVVAKVLQALQSTLGARLRA